MNYRLWMAAGVAVAAGVGCNTSISDAQQPIRNNSTENNYANQMSESKTRDAFAPQHGNADRP
ncbi:hypothetical protein FACS1894139_02220 [Planctomycetales bacterium]|nr:hypothetical protein FACS1894107_10950 [Planctomycetales bacterium]GHS96428.1 hypothetical protein FACS1894108_01020 [Planctomycetales bacterium]GHT02984.1 hypothetical protein FACS1894139_02220 [Planctomycetales bacterium]GHV21329.1 hypothetical protein AGMMS49959_10280 [Planctomycetales bacterium]